MAKKESVVKASSAKTEAKRELRPYPRITLEKCLIIGQKIRELNGGNPWGPKEVGKAIGLSITNNDFVYYAASSREFGITSGTRHSEVINIEPLGKEIIYADTPEIEREKKIEAFLKVPIFKKVLEHYKGSVLPEMTYLSNTLENKFKLSPTFHKEFADLFNQNCSDLHINKISDSDSAIILDDKTIVAENVEVVSHTSSSKGPKKGLKRIFVAIPFSEKNPDRPLGFFKEVLQSLITPAVEKAGFEAYTANIKGSDIIHSTIINELLNADLVVADLTDHNPNVLFELGMRMALDKPVVIIKAKGTGSIFDVDNMMRYFEYNPVLWKSSIETDIPELSDHIKAAWEDRDSTQTYMKLLRQRK
jgi:nucleoside 2-deoxyribosyltransferase